MGFVFVVFVVLIPALGEQATAVIKNLPAFKENLLSKLPGSIRVAAARLMDAPSFSDPEPLMTPRNRPARSQPNQPPLPADSTPPPPAAAERRLRGWAPFKPTMKKAVAKVKSSTKPIVKNAAAKARAAKKDAKGFIQTVKDGVHSAMEAAGDFVHKVTPDTLVPKAPKSARK